AIKEELSDYVYGTRRGDETLDTGYIENESQQRATYRDLVKICTKISFNLKYLNKKVFDLYPNYRNEMIIKVLCSIYRDIRLLMDDARYRLGKPAKILSTELLKTLKSLKKDIFAIRFEGLLEKLNKEGGTFRGIDNVVLTIIQPIKTYSN